jgi:metalloprotease ARX1
VYQSNERGIAEPTSVNVNSCIRKYSPLPDEEGYVLQEGDVVTVSLGVHIDGYAVIASQTIHIQSIPSPSTGPVADATCALHFVTRGIINLLSTGSTTDIDTILREGLQTFGVSVVEGSCLRRIRRFLVGQTTIEELHPKVLELGSPVPEFAILPGEVYLLDLAISTGTGHVRVHSDLRPTIYTRSIPRSKTHSNFKLQATRTLFTRLTSDRSMYSVFPFTLRQHPDPARAKLGVAELVTHGILQPCPVLLEKSQKAIVVRKTVTVYVRKRGDVVVLCGGEQEMGIMWVRSEKGVRPGGPLEMAVKGDGVKITELRRVEGEKMDLE